MTFKFWSAARTSSFLIAVSSLKSLEIFQKSQLNCVMKIKSTYLIESDGYSVSPSCGLYFSNASMIDSDQ